MTTFGYRNEGLILNGSGLSGDSGGPVFNSAGRLVGILSASSGIGGIAETDYLRLAEPTIYAWIMENTEAPVVVSAPASARRAGLARRIR